MKENERKCSRCGKIINLDTDDFLKEKTRYIHTQCFIAKKKRKRMSETEINDLITNMRLEMNKKSKESNDRHKFIEYLQDQYDVNLTNKYFFVKLSSINNGTYRGLKEGISYEDLLYMFQKKQKELNNIAFTKIKKGQPFKDSVSRIFFDLAVIVNKYDSFKKWKQKQKILEAESNTNIEIENNKINFKQFDFDNINKQNDINEVDISSIIDDI